MLLRRCLAVLLTVLALTSLAQAQLLVGYDEVSTSGADQAWNVDPSSGASSVLWGGAAEVWGMAYGNGTVYANDGSTLYGASLGGLPTALGTIADAAGNAQSVVGLAWANGGLYASRNIANEAIYSIDLDTLVASVLLDYEDADWDFGGLAYNPADGLFYGTNDDTTPNGSGLYSIDAFGGGGINLVTPYPAGETDIDGLAIGNGVAYLVEDEAGDTIHPYDLGAGAYLPSITSPMQTSELFSGAAWVPEPASGGLLSLSLLGLLAGYRRR